MFVYLKPSVYKVGLTVQGVILKGKKCKEQVVDRLGLKDNNWTSDRLTGQGQEKGSQRLRRSQKICSGQVDTFT